MDNQMSSSGSPPCVQLDSLKTELMKHIEAFEILSGLNSDLKAEILIKNLKKVLENVSNPKDFEKKKNGNSSRNEYLENEVNQNPERNSSRPSRRSNTTLTKIAVPKSSRKGRQNKEKLNVEKEQVGKVIENSRKTSSSNSSIKIANELYWGDFEKRRSIRRKSSASTSKYNNKDDEGEMDVDDSNMNDQNNIVEEEDVKVDMNSSNLTSMDESLDLNNSNESIEKKLVEAEEGTPTFVYECTICNKQLTYEWNAKRHVKQVHFKERFFCPNSNFGCNRAFYNQTRLKYHVSICNARQRSKNKTKSIPIPTLNLVLNNPFKNFKLQKALNARVLVTPLIFANNKSPTSNLETQEFPAIPKLTKQSTNSENPSIKLIKRDNNSPPPLLIPSDIDYSPTVVTFDFVRQDVFRSPPPLASSKTSIHEVHDNNQKNHESVDSSEILNVDLKFKVPATASATENGREIEDENEEEEEEENIANEDDESQEDENVEEEVEEENIDNEDDENQEEENEQNLNKADVKQDDGKVMSENPHFVPTTDIDNNNGSSEKGTGKETVEVSINSNETDSSFNDEDDDEDMENNSLEDSSGDPIGLNCDLEIDAIEKPQSVKSSQNKLVVQSSVPLTQCQDTSKL